jgi:hypothetical protein
VRPVLLLILASFLALPTLAAKPQTVAKQALRPLPEGVLDTAAVHALYLDGDFAPAIKRLEEDRQAGRLKSHQDSVFTFKHLGVMYAAEYKTLELGKSYMYQLLSIEPSVKIMDMYASDMIYMIFRNMQEEFELRRARPKHVLSDTSRQTDTSLAQPQPHPKPPAKRTWPYWTAGAVAVAGAGLASYFLFFAGTASGTHYEGGL